MRTRLKKIASTVLMIVLFMIQIGPAQAQYGCTANDQQVIARYYQDIAAAAMRNNYNAIGQYSQQLANSLSPGCIQQLQQYQGTPYGYGGYGGYGGNYQGGSVYDHGGGAYSSGGVYCGPGGCVGP